MHTYDIVAWTESPHHGCLEQSNCISTDLAAKNSLILLETYFKANKAS